MFLLKRASERDYRHQEQLDGTLLGMTNMTSFFIPHGPSRELQVVGFDRNA